MVANTPYPMQQPYFQGTGSPPFGNSEQSGYSANYSSLQKSQIGTQNYLPIDQKREFSKDEKKKINQGLNQWWPAMYASYSTPTWQLLASPTKSGILWALTASVLGGLYTLALCRNKLLGFAITGAMATLTGILGTCHRRQQNDNILDLIQRLPSNSTKRDLLADPAYQADLNRKNQREAAMMHSWC